MFSGLISFLGGSAFRMVWGELSSYFTRKQETRFELERMTLQDKLDGDQHARNLEALRVQADLGVKTIAVQRDADVAREEAAAFRDAIANAYKPTGIWFIDAWNGSVRPAFATVVLLLWIMALVRQDWVLVAWDLDMMGAIAGFYFADRSLGKRGK